MNNNLISVLIPSYNAEKTISYTIESVLNQSYKNFELIIVDDKSTDNTINLILKYNDPRIKLFINEKNLGFHGNWNKVLSKASGKYIKILPDDDLLEPSALEMQFDVLEKFPNVVLVASKRYIINENNKVILTRGKQFCNVNPCSYKDIIKPLYRFGSNPIGEPGNVLIRAENIKFNNINFDGTHPHYIDLDFYVKILKTGDYYYIDKILSSFRVWGKSYSVSNSKENFKESIIFFNNLKNSDTTISNLDYLICKLNIYKFRFIKYIFYKLIYFISKYFISKN